MKTCICCGIEKTNDSYYINKNNIGGYFNTCISCYNEKVRNHYRLNIEKERVRSRAKSKKQQISKEAKKIISEKWSKNNKHKKNAHLRVKRAIKKGLLYKNNCFLCESDNAQAHHNDYYKPLSIWWLCSKCHGYVHRLLRVVRRTQ